MGLGKSVSGRLFDNTAQMNKTICLIQKRSQRVSICIVHYGDSHPLPCRVCQLSHRPLRTNQCHQIETVSPGLQHPLPEMAVSPGYNHLLSG